MIPLALAAAFCASPAFAQQHDHAAMQAAQAAAGVATTAAETDAPMVMPPRMQGAYGAYPMTREASGTSWQPDSTPMEGLHDMGSTWMTMWHGKVTAVLDRQGGPRGARQRFAESMLMFMGQRQLAGGTDKVKFSAGALVSKYQAPALLDPIYGSAPSSYMLFFRARLGM